MSKHTYRILEYVGSSPTSHDDAIRNAVARAATDNANLRWFQVVETRGHIEGSGIAHWQVVIKVGHSLLDP